MDDKLDLDRVVDLDKVDEGTRDKRVEWLPEPVGLEILQVAPRLASDMEQQHHHQRRWNDDLESALVIMHGGAPHVVVGSGMPHQLDFALLARS